MDTNYHIPVLLHECIDALKIDPNGIYIDATFGGGGHAKAIFEKLNQGRLFGFDQDVDAQKNVIQNSRFTLIAQNFRYMQKFLRLEGITKVDGILADLGVSSHQFDEAERGFSIRFEADLDMRMDKSSQLSAASVINTYSDKQLQQLFSSYGEVRNSKQLAEAIVVARNANPITTTTQLKTICESVVKGMLHRYLAQVFQAIRMEVNDEMGALKEMLESTYTLLKPGGRLVVISYHSLEDRFVKNVMKTGNVAGIEQIDILKGSREKLYQIQTKKPILPNSEEQQKNSRSRSAKLRIAEKI